MITRTACCFNLPPPTSNPSFNTKPPPLLPLVNDEGRWRRQCILMKMACVLIGLELGNMVAASEKQIGLALPPPAVPVVAARWSEKRICPSWLPNSLETVVPENLPRPAARRRYEAVRSSSSRIAPPLSASAQIKNDCFSL